MANAKVWKNVAVAMESARAAGKTITNITKANPGVASSTAHGYANGDILVLEVQGMYQVDQRVVRVAGQTADTFQLEGIDTTGFDTFSSGTAYKITLGTSITTATSISSSGGDFEFIDTTTIHASQRSQQPGLPNATTFSMDNIWDPADPGLAAMKSASDAQQRKAFAFTFGQGGAKMYFAGYVGASLLPGGQAQGLVTTGTAITMQGFPSYYAS
jgi:hypothetical protein